MAKRPLAQNDSAFNDVEDLPEDGPAAFAEDGATVFLRDDGGVDLEIEDEDGDPAEKGSWTENEFDDNLAEHLSESEQVTLGSKLKEFIEVDLQSRSSWERRMLDGLEIIGLEDIPDDAVAFEGAARVTYPGIAEAMIQFQARAMDELMPPEGPVQAGVIGKVTDELEARAKRVQDYMNYQLTEEDDEYYWETDDMLLYLPYAGSAFRKVGIDPVLGRTRSRFVPASDFIVPYWAKSLQTAPRYTHRYSMPLNTFKRAVAAGYFVDADFERQLSSPAGNSTTTTRLEDVADDKSASYHDEDRDLQLYEITIDWEFDWEMHGQKDGEKLKFKLPYTITLEWETQRVVRIARCWNETDENCKRDVWYVHYKFLPGMGFYGWGYLHLIGGLGRAASGAMRLLLDGAATSSLQGGFKSRDARMAGDQTFTPGVWADVDMTSEELAKAFYSPPFKEPSPALFKTLEILITGVQRFASTTEAMVGDASNQGPVGTTVALIEQGSKIFSGIHKRIHAAARIEFKLVATSNFRYMDMEEYPYDVEGGDKEVFKDDFGPKIDIVPVSDPNIFSSVQRIALAQAMTQMVTERPDLFSLAEQKRAYRGMIKALRVPSADKYLPETDDKHYDPVSENVGFLSGVATHACPDQDDEAHLAVHTAFEMEVMGMDPEIQAKVIPALKAHKAQHYANAYRKRIEQAVMAQTGVPLPPYDPNKPEENEQLPFDIENAVARAVAQFAPPPPPPQAPAGPEQQSENSKDEMAAREADRKDMLADREAKRSDMKMVAELRRDGLVSDVAEIPPEQ
jgi:hypothetical protein